MTIIYDVPAGGDATADLLSGGTVRYGIELNGVTGRLVGKPISTITFSLKKTGTPTGNITATVRRASDDTVVASFQETLPISSVTTSFVSYLFTLASPYTLQNLDRIQVEYAGTTKLTIEVYSTDQFDGVLTRRTRFTTSYATANTTDIVGRITDGTFATNVDTRKYNIRILTGVKTNTRKYNIRKLTGVKTNTFIYKIRQLATKINTRKYNIRRIASKANTFIYKIRQLTGVKAQTLKYNIRKLTGQNTNTFIYKIRQLATNIDTRKYNIRRLVADNYSVFFDGVDESINLGSEVTLWSQSLTKFSFSLWVYPTSASVGGVNRMIVNHGWDAVDAFLLYAYGDGNNYAFGVQAGGYETATSSVTLVANTWQHVTCVFDSTLGSANIKIYVDSIVGPTTANKTTPCSVGVLLELSDPSFPWKGHLRDFRWWTTKALTPAEVVLVKNNDPSAPAPNYWQKLNAGNGSPTDSIGGTFTGTFLLGARWSNIAPHIFVLEHILKYNIRLLTGVKINTYKYNIRQLVSKTNTFIYKIRQLATNIDTHKYNIRKIASKANTFIYNIRKLTGQKTNTFIYKIRQLATNVDTHKYNIRISASSVDTYIYKIRKLVAQTDTHIYKIRKLATNQDTYRYNIRKLTGLKTTTYKYNIRVAVSKINTMIYKIRSISGIKVVTYKYKIRQLARNTDTNKYNIRIKSGLSTDTHKYNIRIKTGVKINTYIYKIRKLASKINTRKYKIRQLARNTDTNIYNIRTKAAKTTTYKYSIRTLVSRLNTRKYKIRQLVTSVFTYIYNISPDVRNTDLSIILTNWLRNNWPEDPYSTVDHYLIPPRSKITFGRRFDLTSGSHSDMHIHVRSIHENPMFVNTDATGEDNDDLINIYVEVRFIPEAPLFSSDSPAPPSRMMWHIRSFIDELVRSNPEQLNSAGIDIISLVQELPDANTTPDVHGQSAIEQMYTIIFTVKAYYHIQVNRLT